MALFAARKEARRSADERERFYLLPGQGGSGYRRKQKLILKTSILVGVLVSLILAAAMYLLSRPPR